MSIFKPTVLLDSIFDIDADFIKRHHLKALLLDVDNTLAIYQTREPVPGVMKWIETMRALGVDLHILSNAKPKRLTAFANQVHLPYFYMSLKPLPFKISKAVKKLGVEKQNVALVGDQLFTDILGGNLAGVQTVWVQYMQLEDGWTFQCKRRIETRFRKKYRR